MRITVQELATMWRSAADGLRGSDIAPQDSPECIARADQLDACASDLVNTQFHHDLVIDPDSKRKWWKIL